jgi:hypothetical protein
MDSLMRSITRVLMEQETGIRVASYLCILENVYIARSDLAEHIG